MSSNITQLEELSENKTYPVKYVCGNCGKTTTCHVPVGHLAGKEATCTHCLCSASKCWPGF